MKSSNRVYAWISGIYAYFRPSVAAAHRDESDAASEEKAPEASTENSRIRANSPTLAADDELEPNADERRKTEGTTQHAPNPAQLPGTADIEALKPSSKPRFSKARRERCQINRSR